MRSRTRARAEAAQLLQPLAVARAHAKPAPPKKYPLPHHPTLDNATSSKYHEFMERSIPVRALAIPGAFEIGGMLWGYFPNKLLYYSLGLFNGAGQNLKSQSDWPALIGRAFVAPLAPFSAGRRWMTEMWVGGSIFAHRAVNLGGAIEPSTSGSTQNDLNNFCTRQGPLKSGSFDGLGYYIEAWGWVIGDMTILSTPSLPGGSKLKHPLSYAKQPRWGIKVLAKYEHLNVDIGKLLAGPPDMMGKPLPDPAEGHYAIDAFSLGADAWLTQHVRLTANYVANIIGGLGDHSNDAPRLKNNFYLSSRRQARPTRPATTS